MSEPTSQSTGLFDKLYSAGKEVFDAAKKPLVKNSIKRKLQAAYDDAESKSNDAKIKIQKTRQEFDKYDVNVILEQKAIVNQCQSLQNQIKEEYKELFLKDMVFDND